MWNTDYEIWVAAKVIQNYRNKQIVYLYRVSQNVCAPLKVQIERKLMNKNDLSTIGPR